MKSYGFGPAYPAARLIAQLPPRENWKRYTRDREDAVSCGRCEEQTLTPALAGWAYRRFSTPLFTEVRCAACLKSTGVVGGHVSEEPA
jgi:hypothetical protein